MTAFVMPVHKAAMHKAAMHKAAMHKAAMHKAARFSSKHCAVLALVSICIGVMFVAGCARGANSLTRVPSACGPTPVPTVLAAGVPTGSSGDSNDPNNTNDSAGLDTDQGAPASGSATPTPTPTPIPQLERPQDGDQENGLATPVPDRGEGGLLSSLAPDVAEATGSPPVFTCAPTGGAKN